MTPLPLEDIRLNSQSHLSALWWIGLGYRRPRMFYQNMKQLPALRSIIIAAILSFHIVPWILIACAVVRLFLVIFLDCSLVPKYIIVDNAVLLHVFYMLVAILKIYFYCICFFILVAFAFFVVHCILGQIYRIIHLEVRKNISCMCAEFMSLMLRSICIFSFFFGLVNGFESNSLFLLIFAFLAGLFFGTDESRDNISAVAFILLSFLWYVLVVAGVFVWGISNVNAFSYISGVFFAMFAFDVGYLRGYYYLGHWIFLLFSPCGSRYYYHPVAWDNLCRLPFSELNLILLDYAEYDLQQAEDEIERLISEYPSQRMNALRARTALLARKAVKETDFSKLSQIVNKLPGGNKDFLMQSTRICEMVEEIGRVQMRLNTIDRPVFQEPMAEALCAKIEQFRDQVAGFREPLASEFRSAASAWIKVAKSQLAQARAVVNREPTPQVFRAGDPVDRTQEAFVPRNAVFGELERQITLSTGCPGLILYGRRRVGKSTVLRNMSGFVPPSVHVITVSMQDPRAFTSLRSLLETIARAIRDTVSSIPSDIELPDNLSDFYAFLSSCNDALRTEGQRLILAIDEYETIDEKIGENVFPLDLLSTLRESIQKHRQITWSFAGSHEISELKHAPWTSYLVSARTVEILPFSEAETRLLLTEPLKWSSIWERNDPKRPRFTSSFWGDDGIERIHAEAGGWPHLVQLIAEMVVDLLNDTEQRQVDDVLMEDALDKAIVRGDTVLRELMERECISPMEWDYLLGFRMRDFQTPPDDEAVYRSLRRRLLVSEENMQWRLRVPLMQRWLRKRS